VLPSTNACKYIKRCLLRCHIYSQLYCDMHADILHLTVSYCTPNSAIYNMKCVVRYLSVTTSFGIICTFNRNVLDLRSILLVTYLLCLYYYTCNHFCLNVSPRI
jgi:hypothetical protein